MADRDIAGLTAAGALDGTELVHIVQGGNSRKTDLDAISALADAGPSYEAGPRTVPDTSGWTAWNIGTSVITTTATGITFVPQNGGVARGRYTAVPAAPFDIYMRYRPFNYGAAAPQNWHGILLRDNADGESLIMGVNGTTSPRFEVGRMTSLGGYSASGFSLFANVYGIPPWIRVNVGAATITFYISFNGLDWIQIGTETIATYIDAVTHWGFVDYIDGANVGGIFIDYLSTTAPV